MTLVDTGNGNFCRVLVGLFQYDLVLVGGRFALERIFHGRRHNDNVRRYNEVVVEAERLDLKRFLVAGTTLCSKQVALL